MMVPGYPIGLWKNHMSSRFPFDWAIWGLFGGIPYGLPRFAKGSHGKPQVFGHG